MDEFDDLLGDFLPAVLEVYEVEVTDHVLVEKYRTIEFLHDPFLVVFVCNGGQSVEDFEELDAPVGLREDKFFLRKDFRVRDQILFGTLRSDALGIQNKLPGRCHDFLGIGFRFAFPEHDDFVFRSEIPGLFSKGPKKVGDSGGVEIRQRGRLFRDIEGFRFREIELDPFAVHKKGYFHIGGRRDPLVTAGKVPEKSGGKNQSLYSLFRCF